jgi:serine/threonine protein kinase
VRLDSPRWEEINPSEFAHEKDGLRELAGYLPDADPYHVWANVEFVANDGSINEIDALVLAPSGLYVVELKHWQGEVAGDGLQWVHRAPNGRLIPEDNPYILANRKAKRLAGLIRHYARGQAPFVGALVFLHAKLMQSKLDEVGRQHVYGLDSHAVSNLPSFKQFLLAHPKNAEHLVDAVRGRQIVEMVKAAKIRPSVRDRKVDGLLLLPKPFAEGNGWQDYLAGHSMDTSLFRRVRFYLTSRATDEELPVIRRAAEREFRLLQGMYHPGIPRAVNFVDHAWGPAVIFDHDRSWERFDQWLTRRGAALTLAQKLTLAQDLAEILDYAHSRRLSHRALSPRTIFVANPDSPHPSLVVTDWQTGGRLAGATQVTRLSASTDGAGLELFFDDETRRYQAPEATSSGQVPGVQLDVFSLGALAYRIFAGAEPATSAEELLAAVRDGGLNLAAVVDGMPDSLTTLIYDATRADPGQRIGSVARFRTELEKVWDELTAPEPEPVVDPLTAHKGDRLDGGLTVLGRLGSGATATALSVRTDDGRDLVLKVARDEQHAGRLAAEARALQKLGHWQVAALVQGPVKVGGRTALLLESAGPRTLAEDLAGRRLALDLLERYGKDLLDIVTLLDGYGVWHRDIKPANLAARPRPKDKQPHLCVFDFSLAEAPADDVKAGTVPYLDPFLGPPRRMRYDAAAERFSAAVTLYEMATGALPRWGEGANPAAVNDEVRLEPSAFDSAVADRLVDFFRTALARDAADRFATSEEMTDAWRSIFVDIPQAPPPGTVEQRPTRDTVLDATALTPRARSALERLGVHNVGELLDYEPSALTRAQGVPDATRKEILALARVLRPLLAAAEPKPAEDRPLPQGIEAVCATLLPKRAGKERDMLEVLLGQKPDQDGNFLSWPAQAEAARATGQSQPQISIWLRKAAGVWVEDKAVTQVRNEIVALLDTRGSVMSADELAEALIAARGSFTPEPKRLPQAVGLVRAAVEAELTRGGDARLAIYRFRSAPTVLVGREPDDPAALHTAAQRLDYAVRLGRQAAQLAAGDVLPTRTRAIEALRAVDVPEGMPPLTDQRLLQLAATASGEAADVNAQGQLYPVGMAADRALRLAVGSLIGQRLAADAVQARVRARFPRASALPRRPDLDALMSTVDVPLVWDPVAQVYAPRSQPSVTGTRAGTSLASIGGAAEAAEVDRRLTDVLRRNAFLAVLVSFRQMAAARRALLSRLGLTEVDITGMLLDRLRVAGFPWEALVSADSGSPGDENFRSLKDMVAYDVMPAVRKALDDAPGPVLLTEAAPLARYGQMRLLQELADTSRPRPAARLLLVPVRRPEPATLDDVPLPLTSPAGQSLRLPDSWITPTVERTAPR